VAAGIMTLGQASALNVAVEARKNVLVAGGTSSGKTTLTNALLAEVAKTSDRSFLSKTRGSFSARHRISWRYVLRTA